MLQISRITVKVTLPKFFYHSYHCSPRIWSFKEHKLQHMEYKFSGFDGEFWSVYGVLWFSAPSGRSVFRRLGVMHCFRLQGDSPVQLDAEVVGHRGMFWLYRKFGRPLLALVPIGSVRAPESSSALPQIWLARFILTFQHKCHTP